MPEPMPRAKDAAEALTQWAELQRVRSRDLTTIVHVGCELAHWLSEALQQRVDEEFEREQAEEFGSYLVRHVIRAWHESDHDEPWAVCPHPVCREAVTEWGDPWPRGLTLAGPPGRAPVMSTVHLPGDAAEQSPAQAVTG